MVSHGCTGGRSRVPVGAKGNGCGGGHQRRGETSDKEKKLGVTRLAGGDANGHWTAAHANLASPSVWCGDMSRGGRRLG